MYQSTEQKVGPHLVRSDLTKLIEDCNILKSCYFGILMIFSRVLHMICSLINFSAEPGEYEIRKPKTVFSTKFLLMPQDMENYVFGQESSRYIREVW